MLAMDTPGKVDPALRGSHRRLKSPVRKVRCTTLSCKNGIWENDYLTESERRMISDSSSQGSESKTGIRKVIGELQDKLQKMKKKFAEIRAR